MPPRSTTPDPAGRRRGFDALLLVSFGGPEAPDEVMPFLRNVTRGRGVPDSRLAEVAEHYRPFGGSPINDQNRALRAALAEVLDPLPVYWGNRNSAPYLADEVRRMRDDGVARAACFVTSAFSSYSGCRQYRENLADARAAVGPGAPELVKLRQFFDHPGFIQPMVDNTCDALAALPAALRRDARLVFVAHSVPVSQAAASGPAGGAYPRQIAAAAAAIADGVAVRAGVRFGHDVTFCSRSGPPAVPWLTPDIGDHLDALAAAGVPAVVAVPVGFVSDHMEVVHDLDVEAAGRAGAAGLAFQRASTVGTDPRFVTMVRDLLAERAAAGAARPTLPGVDPVQDDCPARCCLPRGGDPTKRAPGRTAGQPAGAPAGRRADDSPSSMLSRARPPGYETFIRQHGHG